MPLRKIPASALPASWQEMAAAAEAGTWYVLFVSGDDAATGQPWCPDVRAALPVVTAFFADREEEVAVVAVGSVAEWRSPSSVFRTRWDLRAIPTLVKYSRTAFGASQSQLVERDCLSEEKLEALVNGS